MSTETPVIEVENLVVSYGKGKKRHQAIKGVSFEVRQGETVGFIGANGAGKSTTIKSIMGFLFPDEGKVRVFGEPAGTTRSRQQLGYLPEVALYYPFMKARELLEIYGGLSGLSKKQLRERIPGLLETVGLGGKGESLLKNFSKGMQQRLGIAQALIAEPAALILDELSSGLDPLGRHDLRQVMLDLKAKGRTIFFSSHELTEIETLCDRVVMIHQGRIVTQASVADLMKPLNQYEIVVPASAGPLPERFQQARSQVSGDTRTLRVEDVGLYTLLLQDLCAANIPVLRTSSQTRSLEDYFISLISPGAGGAA